MPRQNTNDPTLLRELKRVVNDDGLFRYDRRFHVVWLDNYALALITFLPTGSPFTASDDVTAFDWIRERQRDLGDTGPRLGDRIASLTSAIGITKCGACARRQAHLNSILSKDK